MLSSRNEVKNSYVFLNLELWDKGFIVELGIQHQ